MRVTRREALRTGLVGAGVLLTTRAANASSLVGESRQPQFVILSTSPACDPLNTNVPLTYDVDLCHPLDPGMAATKFELGGKTQVAARPWAELAELGGIGDRLCFFHHATSTESHAESHGPLALATFLARHLAPMLGTRLSQPILLGPSRWRTQELPTQRPIAVRTLLADEGDEALHPTLSAIRENGAMGQILAAVALIRRKVSPVVTLELPFGGDNHTDTLLAGEARSTLASVSPYDGFGRPRTTGIPYLYAQLTRLGLADQVTLLCMNGFGRTLKKHGLAGRDHLASHHVTVAIGRHLRSGVIGGIEPSPDGRDYRAMAIDAATGRGLTNSDIAIPATQAAVEKTVAAAVGLPVKLLDSALPRALLIEAALA